jgi:DNA helicase-4
MNTTRGLSFPSKQSDDPLIETFLARRDKFPHAEERRLFYVALTRARKKAYLLFRRDSASIFVLELMNPKYQGRVLFRGKPDLPRVCPACYRGFLVERRPLFFGCSRYHGKDRTGCNYTRSSNPRHHFRRPKKA